MKERMRVRTPASNGSNQSSPRKSAVSAASAAGDVVSVVMACSPPALQRRSWLGEQAGDYAALTFQPLPRRHQAALPEQLFDVTVAERIVNTRRTPAGSASPRSAGP